MSVVRQRGCSHDPGTAEKVLTIAIKDLLGKEEVEYTVLPH